VLSLGEINQEFIPGSGSVFRTASIQTGSETHTGLKWPALVKNMYSFLRFPVILAFSIKKGYNFILIGISVSSGGITGRSIYENEELTYLRIT